MHVVDYAALRRKKTYEAVIERRRELLKVEPYVERAGGGNVDIEVQLMKTGQDMITLLLKMLLQGNLLHRDMCWVEERNGC